MRLYVRFVDDRLNSICCCKSFKCYEGKLIDVQVDDNEFEQFPELVLELDTGEVVRGILGFEAS